MSKPDFEAMTVEEIEEFRIAKREQMRELRAEIIESREVYNRKLSLRYLGARLREPHLEHLSTEDATALMAILNKNPRESDVVVAVDSSDLTVEAGVAEVN